MITNKILEMKAIRKFFKRMKAPTPLFWKRVRNVSSMITAIATTITAIPQVSAPAWWVKVAWYILAISAATTIYAQQKEMPEAGKKL